MSTGERGFGPGRDEHRICLEGSNTDLVEEEIKGSSKESTQIL